MEYPFEAEDCHRYRKSSIKPPSVITAPFLQGKTVTKPPSLVTPAPLFQGKTVVKPPSLLNPLLFPFSYSWLNICLRFVWPQVCKAGDYFELPTQNKDSLPFPFFIYKDNLFQALLYYQYIFRLVQRVSKKTKKPLLLSLFLQQKSEIWILLTMPVKYWLPLPTRWKLEATLSMKDGTKILLLQRVSVLFFPPLLAGNWVKFQLNEPLSHPLGIFYFISPAGYGQS